MPAGARHDDLLLDPGRIIAANDEAPCFAQRFDLAAIRRQTAALTIRILGCQATRNFTKYPDCKAVAPRRFGAKTEPALRSIFKRRPYRSPPHLPLCQATGETRGEASRARGQRSECATRDRRNRSDESFHCCRTRNEGQPSTPRARRRGVCRRMYVLSRRLRRSAHHERAGCRLSRCRPLSSLYRARSLQSRSARTRSPDLQILHGEIGQIVRAEKAPSAAALTARVRNRRQD